MRSFIFVLSVATVLLCVYAQDANDKGKALHEKCVVETSVDEELVNKARNGEFADDPKLRSYAVCIVKKIGLQDASGNIDKDARQKLSMVLPDSAMAEKVFQQCAKEMATPEETAVESFKCYYKTISNR